MFSLHMSNARPMNLILTSSDKSYAALNLSKDVNLYVSPSLTFRRLGSFSQTRVGPFSCIYLILKSRILFLLSAP